MARSILITGSSSGIGREAALTLAERGWWVFPACRRRADAAEWTAEGFISPVIDYESPDSIAEGLRTVLEATGGTLDAVYNNGAYAIPGALEDLPPAGLRAILEANLVGWHDLTRRAIPVMRAQGHGRIVMCSSVLGMVAVPWRGAYVATKFALEGYTDTLRLEMADTPVKVSTIAPGPIDTPFRQNARRQFERWIEWHKSPRAEQYRRQLRPRLYAENQHDKWELPAAAVVKKLVHALESPRPRARYHVTRPTYAADALRRLLPVRLRDRVLARG